MDSQIKQLRNKFRRSKSDDEALDILKQIDKLQRARHLATGSFLPHEDGRVYYYDFDYQQWMAYFEGVK